MTPQGGRPEGHQELLSSLGEGIEDDLHPHLPGLEDGEERGDQEILAGLYKSVRDVHNHKQGYWLLLWFTMFTAVYVTVLYLQSDTHTTYLVASAHNPLLTPGYAPDGSNSFSSTDDVFNWLNTSIIQSVWVDVSQTCGNGVCDVPLEYPAFGPDNRFGCAADCGIFPNTSTVSVQIGTSFSSAGDQANSSWNICFADGDQQCWYEGDQTFTGALDSTQSLSLPLPDANYTLKLNAPNGGLGIILTSESGTKVLEVGYGCDVIPSLDSRSNYTICRQNCTDYYNACGSNTNVNCGGNWLPPEVVIYWFNQCLQNCTSDAALTTSQTMLSLLSPVPKCAYNETQASKLNAPNLCDINVVVGDYEYIFSLNQEGVAAEPISSQYVPATETPATWRNILWDKLGPTDNVRLAKLAAAVSRTLYTMIKDECLVKTAKYLSSGKNVTYFLCLYFGGPTGHCPYSDPTKGAYLAEVTDEALLESMATAHSRYLYYGQDQMDRFVDMVTLALQSVVDLDDTTVAAFKRRLHLLDQVLVGSANAYTCTEATTFIPFGSNSAGSGLDRTVHVGDVVQWVWTDDNTHSIVPEASSTGGGLAAHGGFHGIGGGNLGVSRKTICTPHNVFSTGFDQLPYPCNLVDPSQASYPFTYSWWFTEDIVKNKYYLQPQRDGDWDPKGNNTLNFCSNQQGDRACGSIYLNGTTGTNSSDDQSSGAPPPSPSVPPPHSPPPSPLPPPGTAGSPPALTTPPPPAAGKFHCLYQTINGETQYCYLDALSNGYCDNSCKFAACGFDLGDCVCPINDDGEQVCGCPPGQIRGYEGVCCDTLSVGTGIQSNFNVSNFGPSQQSPFPKSDEALYRSVATQNRLLVGLYISQVRGNAKKCSSNGRFNFLKLSCNSGGTSTEPYGTAPQVLLESSLYDQQYVADVRSLTDSQNGFMSNSSLAISPNTRKPYGFLIANLSSETYSGQTYGFQYIFDINLSPQDAQNQLQYMHDGFFFDNATESVKIRLITYNGDAQFFSLVKVVMTFEIGGRIAIKADTKSIVADHYKSWEDWLRFALEVVFLVGLAINIVEEVKELLITIKTHRSSLPYFTQFWNLVDFISIGIMVAGVILWIRYILVQERTFKIQPRYNIYETPLTSYTYWKLDSTSGGFQNAMVVMDHLEKMAFFRGYYTALQGINIFLVVLRLLKLMDFQPRMGVITRTIGTASQDLLHFFILWVIVFCTYSLFGNIAFGRIVEDFRTIGSSFNTCFLIIVGENGPASSLFQLEGWELAAGVIFYWSFILVFLFVVMNLIIGIVVDAFTKVKDELHETNPPSFPTEVVYLLHGAGEELLGKKLSNHQQLMYLKQLGAKSAYIQREGQKGVAESAPEGRVVIIDGKHHEYETVLAALQRAQLMANGSSKSPSQEKVARLSASIVQKLAVADQMMPNGKGEHMETVMRALSVLQEDQEEVKSTLKSLEEKLSRAFDLK